MSESVSQVGWTSERHGVRWSKGALWKRFSIVRTGKGYTVCDHQTHELVRVTTFAGAKNWVGIRVNEQCVRH